jgi:rRNA maturation RNase YbeY
MINIVCSSRYKINRSLIKEKTADILRKSGYQNEPILNLVFIGKNKMREIANKYKKEDEALPVLTFAYDEETNEDDFLGEIFLCYPQIVLLAAERDKKVDRMIMMMIEHGINNLLK